MYKCDNTAPLRVRIPADMMDSLIQISNISGLSVSEVVRQILRSYFS